MRTTDAFWRPVQRGIQLTVERLESRVMLHGGEDLGDSTGSPEHIPVAGFLEQHPELAGLNLWDPSVFNPRNSSNPADWLYDPHKIENPERVDLPDLPPVSAQSSVLPDLVPLTGGSYLSPVVDKTEIPGHNLLRFTTAVGNMGTAPAILTSANSGTPPAGSGITSWINPDGTQNVLQELFDYNGSSFSLTGYRPGGHMVWHNGHGHFHLEGYARYRLLTSVGGSPGPVALRSGFDNAPAVGEKVGFCLVNILSSFTLPGGGSSSSLAGYNKPGQPSTSCGFLQGIHVGRADVYDSQYDGQWIDVTGVPNGSYFLEVTLDANNVIQETDESNNTVLVPITLNTSSASGGTVLPDRFEPNDSFAAATDLGVSGVQAQSGLTAHVSSESDYFKFVAASSGTYNVQLTIADRDLNLYLYDAAQNLLGSSTSPASGTSTNPVSETVNWNFVAGQTYYIRAQAFGSDLNPTTSAISSNYALKINVNPTLDTTTADSQASEVASDSGQISIARNGPVSSPLLVNFSVTGTATRGVDFDIYQDGVLISGNSITIGNEASSAKLDIVPIGDALVEPSETVILTVNTSSAYVIGGSNSGSVTIADTPPVVTDSSFDYALAPNYLTFDFSLDVSASLQTSDLVITNLSSATKLTPEAITYNGGANRASFELNAPIADGYYHAVLGAAGVTHAQGAPLASDATVDFFFLTADANHDATVNTVDFNIFAANFSQSGKTFSEGDFNYDSTVDTTDFGLLASRFGKVLSGDVSRPSQSVATPLAASDAVVRSRRELGQAGMFGTSIITQDDPDDSPNELLI